MIVRNSSDVLERCLESVKEADEIVIVDTGSEDNTIEIAKCYTDKVYEYWGCNEGGKKDGLFANFADARNYSLKKCTGDYILTIDSDEVLEPGAMEVFKQFTGTSMSIKCTAHDTKESHRQPRLYKRHESIYWKGAAHNYLTCYPGEYSDITITYYTNNQRVKDKDRTMRILQNWLKKHPKSPREMYYLAKEYHKRGWLQKAVKMLQRYIPIFNY
jgi:glycosyltransferase involved in cell wall biosynthesis